MLKKNVFVYILDDKIRNMLQMGIQGIRFAFKQFLIS